MSFNILSLDGGGIRGLLTSKLLLRLEKAHPGFLDSIDLVAGTSTGGILALGLAAGIPLDQIVNIYEQKGKEIFTRTFFDSVADIDRLICSDYDNKPLKKELTAIFGNRRLGDLKKKVLITTFKLDSGPVLMPNVRAWKPKFFHNFEYKVLEPGRPAKHNRDCDEAVVDVALRTSAAPTFFPLYQGYTDGGVVANNPSMCALAQALDVETGGQTLEKINLLSVGTGNMPKWLTGVNENWGLKQWAPNLIGIMMDGVSGVADYQCKQLLRSHYVRLNVNFQQDIGLDNLSQISTLVSLANTANINSVKNWLEDDKNTGWFLNN